MQPMIDDTGRELKQHGTFEFPCNSYRGYSDGFPWHWHNEMEMIYVESGALVCAVANQRYTLEAGDAIVVNCGVPHAVFTVGTENYLESDIVFHPRLLYGSVDTTLWDKYFRAFLQNACMEGFPLYRSVDWQRAAARSVLKACRAVDNKQPTYEFVAREELTKVYLAVWTHSAEQCQPSLQPVRSERIKSMMCYLEQHVEDNVTLGELAAFAGLSARACQREFQAYLGMSPMEYLRQTRLGRAANLLRLGGLTVTEVGFQCGFQDASYFAKQFRLRYGVSPRAYQAKR